MPTTNVERRPGPTGRLHRRLHRSERAGCRPRSRRTPTQAGEVEASATEEESDDAEDGEAEEAVDTGPDPEEAARRTFCDSCASCTRLRCPAWQKIGTRRSEDAEGPRQGCAPSSWNCKLSLTRMFEALINQLRNHIGEVRQLERQIMRHLRARCRHAAQGIHRPPSRATRPTSGGWASTSRVGRTTRQLLAKFTDEIRAPPEEAGRP